MSGDPYIKENERLEAEIARLRSDLAVEKINNKRLQSERNNAEAEIARLQDEEANDAQTIKSHADEIRRLQELLRGTGANRYWEERWRDAEAENQRWRAALKQVLTCSDIEAAHHIAYKVLGQGALAKEGK